MNNDLSSDLALGILASASTVYSGEDHEPGQEKERKVRRTQPGLEESVSDETTDEVPNNSHQMNDLHFDDLHFDDLA
jgi:hypothetical protein